MNYLDSLPDGWTIYLWLVAGGLIIIAAIAGIYWAQKNKQFDEDIKYLVFDENDREKMSPEEFKKSREVLQSQMKSRDDFLRAKEEKKLKRG